MNLKLTANRTSGTVMYTRTSSIMHKLGTTGAQVDNYTLTLPMNVTSISQMPDNLTMAFEVTNDIGYRTTAVVATTKVNEGEFQGISFAPVIQKYSIATQRFLLILKVEQHLKLNLRLITFGIE